MALHQPRVIFGLVRDIEKSIHQNQKHSDGKQPCYRTDKGIINPLSSHVGSHIEN